MPSQKLDMLQRRREEDPAKYGSVVLMLDAMAIKNVQYNPCTRECLGMSMDDTDVAMEVLVFLVVGLQGHWKAPVDYYLTKSLSPNTLKVLVVHALEELHARGIKVVCNGWACRQCQHVQPAWMSAKGKPL